MDRHRGILKRTTVAMSIVAAGVCAFSGPAAGQDEPPEAWRADVDAFAKQLVGEDLVPGMGIAITREDRVVYSKGFGEADGESGRDVDDRTLFYIGSTTKSFTALASVLAAHRGDIDLTRPVGRYLPGLRLSPPLSVDSITLHDLLTMTHGIAEGGPVVFRTAFSGEFTREALIELLSEYPPAKTGRAFVYGNLGYNIMGLVLEERFGMSWKQFVEREVLRPLGMTNTLAEIPPAAAERLAMPHTLLPDGYRRVPMTKTAVNMHAAGGHIATAGDLARYLAAHLGAGRVDGRRLLPGEPFPATHRFRVPQERRFGPFTRFGWGYGWDLGTYNGDTLVHRFGTFRGFRSHVSFMPSRATGVVVLVNGEGPASDAADLMATYIYDRLQGASNVDSLYEAKLEELISGVREARRGLEEHFEKRKARQLPLLHPMENFAGAYENPKLGRMVWSIEDEALEVRMGAAWSRAEVYDAAKNQLRVELTGGGAVVEFLFPEEGGSAGSVRYNDEIFVRTESTPGR